MKLIKCMAFILLLTLIAGIGICLCNDAKATENMEEAVML